MFDLTVRVIGVNLDRFIQKVVKIFKIKNIKRISHTEICFSMQSKNFKKLIALNNEKCYTITVLNKKGIFGLFWFIKNNFGYLVGLVIATIILIISNMFILKIDIFGLDNENSKIVKSVLAENGVLVGSLKKTNYNDIEFTLKNVINDISLVSISSKGNVLIVNIKEKEKVETTTLRKDIVADCDGTILDISVAQGTALKKQGDAFKKGDILVKGCFYDNNNQEFECFAIAEIVVDCVYQKSTIVFKEDIIYDKSTDFITNSYFIFKDKEYAIKEYENTFDKFCIEEKTEYLFENFILPIKIKYVKKIKLENANIENKLNNLKEINEENLKSCIVVLFNNEIADFKTQIFEEKDYYIISSIYTMQKTITR